MQKKILIVEDDATLRISLRKILTAHGFKALEASDGAEALERVEKEQPDLVLLDFGLPIVSGETVCVKIKQEHPEIAVIVLTEKASKSEVVHGLQIGADDYVGKPFVAEELIARINARLKNNKESSVTKDDNRILIIRESLVLVMLRIIVAEFLLGMLFFITSFAFSYFGSYFQFTETLSLSFYSGIIIFLANIILIVFIVLKWQSEYSEIRGANVIKHSGIFFRKEQKYACNFVESITIEQPMLGIVFNYGTIALYDPALKEQIYLMNVTNPKKQRKVIEERVAKNKTQEMPFIA